MPAGRLRSVQTVHLGQAGNVRTFNETDLPWGGQLGASYEADGRVWQLVQLDATPTGDVDLIDGGVMYWNDKSAWIVTADASDSEGGANFIAGGCHQAVDISGVSADPYIFIQIGGEQAAVVVAASTVAGDHMTGHASTDNVLTRTAAGTAPVDRLAATAMSTRGNTTSDEGATVANSATVWWHLAGD